MSVYTEINSRAAQLYMKAFPAREWWRRWWSYRWWRWIIHPRELPYVAEPNAFRPTETQALLIIQREALDAEETRQLFLAAKKHGRYT